MKKTAFMFLLMLALGTFTNQTKAQNINFGVRGQLNFSKIINSGGSGEQTGMMFGVYMNMPVYNNMVFFEPEVLYSRKGFEYDGNNYRIDYIEVPLTLRAHFVNPTGILPYLLFGPYVAFKINTDFPGVQSPYSKSKTRRTDFGISVGGGLNFGRMSIGIRYDAGLTNIFKNHDAKNSVFSIVAGVGF